MSIEKNKVVIRKLYEAFDKQDLGLLDMLVAQDYFDHPRKFNSLQSYKQYLSVFFKSFPDSHEVIEDMIAEGDKVCIRLRGSATHKGEFMGKAPTGKKIMWEAISIWRIVDGKIKEMWSFADQEFSKQLGIDITQAGKTKHDQRE